MLAIDVVYPPSVTGSDNYSSEPPLGPLAVYSSLPEEWRVNARFLDSTLLTFYEIESKLMQRKADIVAFSCHTYNYPNAVKLAKIAKDNGAIVIMGGIHITHRRNAILAKMQRCERYIDFLITGFGELAFFPLLQALSEGSNLSEIPNLSYIRNGQIVVNRSVVSSTGNDPLNVPLDYSQIDFQKYSSRFKRLGNLKSAKTIGAMYTQRGCPMLHQRKCVFCSIEQINHCRQGCLVEQDIYTLITKHGCDHIRINDAEFSMNTPHFKQVINAAHRAGQRAGFTPSFYCFERADQITRQKAQDLRSMNVISLLIGYESGSDEMLNSMNKSSTREQNLLATRLLKEYGIDVACAGLVIGAEGERTDTLQETIKFMHELLAIDNTRSILATPLTPLPGSRSFELLLKDLAKYDVATFTRLNNEDIFDIKELIELWCKYKCNVSLQHLINTCEEITQILPSGISYLNISKDLSHSIPVGIPIESSGQYIGKEAPIGAAHLRQSVQDRHVGGVEFNLRSRDVVCQ